VLHFQLVTTDGDVLGARELGRPDWPPGSVIYTGPNDPNLRVVNVIPRPPRNGSSPCSRQEGLATVVRAQSRLMQGEPETLARLKKARSLLVILLATCHETLLAVQAVGNMLDTRLTSDLTAMIARSEDELRALSEKIEAHPD
jgi:hypothetical protein